MSPKRKWFLCSVRLGVILLAVIALADPACDITTEKQAVVFIMDHSQSQGTQGMAAAYEGINEYVNKLPSGTEIGIVSAGNTCKVIRMTGTNRSPVIPDISLVEADGSETDLASAAGVATGMFPPGTARRLVVVGDWIETKGDLRHTAEQLFCSGICVDAFPFAGEKRKDARIVKLQRSHSRLHEGATLSLSAIVESSLSGKGVIRLFENGVEVEKRGLELQTGRKKTVKFKRTPEGQNLYTYLVRLEGFSDDVIPKNNEAFNMIEVRGKPQMLYIEEDRDESRYLMNAMIREGIQLDQRTPRNLPSSLQELAGYDCIIISDVPAYKIEDEFISMARDYVEKLGGGFVMIGGENSFGVGGYYNTPIEEILPVKIRPADKEKQYSTGLVLVIDRSGSMKGNKIEICKSAASATVELLRSKDYIGVVAFDSSASWIVPLTRLGSPSAVARQIQMLAAGGGTNIYPGMQEAYEALRNIKAGVKHMIVLSDGHTSHGRGYTALASRIKNEKITVSTVAVGQGADAILLKSIAETGGGEYYFASDAGLIPKIFTQDTMRYAGKLIHEKPFAASQAESHPMLRGIDIGSAPQLLGYVETNRKATAQVPLLTAEGDVLLAHWRFGLGKVTAFTSDCKSRWAALWITDWSGYSKLWSQMLRETARDSQSRLMDIRIEDQSGKGKISVDVLKNASEFKNNALVNADVFHVPVHTLGSRLKHRMQVSLIQVGPGRYTGEFIPPEPGVYMVRVQSESENVSAGFVYNASREASTGRINQSLMEEVTRMTGGKVIGTADNTGTAGIIGHSHFVELSFLFIKCALMLFLLDIAIRRWNNVLNMLRTVRGLFKTILLIL